MSQSGQAVIKDGKIVIEFSLGHLPQILEGAWACGILSERWKVTDEPTFAKELMIQMNRESENGTTLVHRMCDEAIKKVLESGGDGIDAHPVQNA